MFTVLILAALGQCVGGQCSVSGGFASFGNFAPRYAAPVTYAAPPARYYVAPLPLSTPTCAPTTAVAAPPQQYELRDGYGMVWSHSNPEYLKSWVAGYKAGREAATVRTVARTVSMTADACPARCNCVSPGDCGHPGCNCVANVPPPKP